MKILCHDDDWDNGIMRTDKDGNDYLVDDNGITICPVKDKREARKIKEALDDYKRNQQNLGK